LIPREIKRQTESEPTPRDLLADILEVLIDISEKLDARPAYTGPDDPYAPVLEALASVLGDLDLRFDVDEVFAHAEVDHALDAALKSCGLRDTAALGARFRQLQGRPIAGLIVVRDGRGWRLRRT
jgi:hypothetical protein